VVDADLHVHTTVSDGRLSIEAVPRAAARAGLSAVAITDHDRVHPKLETPVTTRTVDGGTVTMIRGIELRVATPTQRVDLLGYGVRATDELLALVDRIQTDREERGRRIVHAVEDELGIELDVAIEPGLGRPHIARAIDRHAGTELDYGGAFDRLIGDDGPCYYPRSIPDVETGRAVLAEACALVGLAHPLRYAKPAAALALTSGLDAVERHYPYDEHGGPTGDPEQVDRAIERHGLVATGGSDAHGRQLGTAGLSAAAYEPVRAALTADGNDVSRA
jgi:predicted metal-dependent phosphoesterase TrpH